jgi:hypothetical protein
MFKDTKGIINFPDSTDSHISTFNKDLPYDKAGVPVKQIETFPCHKVPDYENPI